MEVMLDMAVATAVLGSLTEMAAAVVLAVVAAEAEAAAVTPAHFHTVVPAVAVVVLTETPALLAV
jgi:hypothetical protein